MFQRYNDPQIYKNIKTAKVLTVISCVLSVLTILTYVIYYEILDFPFGAEEYGAESLVYAKVMFYTGLLWSFSGLISIVSYSHFTPRVQNKKFNDCTTLNSFFMCILVPLTINACIWLVFVILALCGTQSAWYVLLDLASHIGCMLPARIFLYAAAGILMLVRKLIKLEWEKNPPMFVVKERVAQEQIEAAQKAQQDMEQYRPLIEQCGIKFFIKYYRQIVRLPLRDVTVAENYSSQERTERLNAAKKIIDLGLSEFALTDILKRYGDILESAEVEQAKELLANLQTPSQSS